MEDYRSINVEDFRSLDAEDFRLINVEDFKSISVVEGPNHKVIVNNPTKYPLIGLGDQGAVFRLTTEKCVKIYAKEKNAKKELHSYKTGEVSTIFPKLYKSGDNYIILEYVKGVPLDEYILSKGTISYDITSRIVFAFGEMKRLGFKRLNIPMRHLIVTDNLTIKIIDHVNSYSLNHPKPHYLFTFLHRLGLLKLFLEQLKTIDEYLYMEWKESTRQYDFPKSEISVDILPQ